MDQWNEDSIVSNSSEVKYNDCLGFTRDNKEYAIAGSTEGTHFFEITEQGRLKHLDFVKGDFSSAQVIHRDFANYRNYLYSVCDEGPSTLQIIDLQHLPDSVSLIKSLGEPFGRVHNIFIDTTNALLYAFIVTTIENGLPKTTFSMRVFSLSDPSNPVLVFTGPNDIPEVHDGYVRDNIAILNCGFDGLRVYDFTNASSPVFLQNMDIYSEQGYNHQGWLSPNGQTYVFADETNGKKIKFCSKDQSGEWKIKRFFGSKFQEGSIPHNIQIDDHFIYVAYYNEGLRIYSYQGSIVTEVAYFDTYTIENAFKMNGAWGVFTDFKSDRIIVSDRHNGLFLFDFDRSYFKNTLQKEYVLYPNPVLAGSELSFQVKQGYLGNIQFDFYTADGKHISSRQNENYSYTKLTAPHTSGIYFLKIKYRELNNEEREIIERIVVH